MKTIEYRTIDKSGWDRGEWDDEPDKKQWQDETTGLPCLIVRGGVRLIEPVQASEACSGRPLTRQTSGKQGLRRRWVGHLLGLSG